jgi:hypothetical protein
MSQASKQAVLQQLDDVPAAAPAAPTDAPTDAQPAAKVDADVAMDLENATKEAGRVFKKLLTEYEQGQKAATADEDDAKPAKQSKPKKAADGAENKKKPPAPAKRKRDEDDADADGDAEAKKAPPKKKAKKPAAAAAAPKKKAKKVNDEESPEIAADVKLQRSRLRKMISSIKSNVDKDGDGLSIERVIHEDLLDFFNAVLGKFEKKYERYL